MAARDFLTPPRKNLEGRPAFCKLLNYAKSSDLRLRKPQITNAATDRDGTNQANDNVNGPIHFGRFQNSNPAPQQTGSAREIKQTVGDQRVPKTFLLFGWGEAGKGSRD